MKKTCLITRLAAIFAIFFCLFYISSKHTLAVNISLGNYGNIDVNFGTTISSSISNAVVSYFNSFSGKKPYFKIIDPTTALLSNPNFQILDSAGANWYFSFSNTANASQFLSSYTKSAVVEIRGYDKNALTTFKNQHPQIKLHAPGENWASANRAQQVLKNLPPPILDAYSFQLDNWDNLDDYDWGTIGYLFDLLFDGSSCLACSGGYPTSSKFSLYFVDFDNPKGKNYLPDRASSFAASFSSAVVTNSVQKQQDSAYAPTRYAIWRAFDKLSEPEQKILYYFVDFVQQSNTLAWPNAHPANGNPYGFHPDGDPIVGVVGKRADGEHYAILTNVTENNEYVNLKGANLQGYEYYSTTKGKGSFTAATGVINLDGFETIVTAPTLGDISPVPTSPPASPTSPPPSPTSGLSPSPTPTGPFFSNNFEIMGKVATGDLYQPEKYWQSGDYCPGYPIQNFPSLININGYLLGKLGVSTLCAPQPYYLYDYYAAGSGNIPPDGEITLTLQNLPDGYDCVGWTWSGDTIYKEGTGCSLTEDFRYQRPFSGADIIKNGKHLVSFYIKEGQPTPTPPKSTPRPTRTPTPLPVMGAVEFMMVKLGKLSSNQPSSLIINVLISFFDWIRWLQKHQ